MSLPVPMNEKPVRTSQKMSYFDAALSVFERPRKTKPHYQRTSKHHRTVSAVSSEDLLRRDPSRTPSRAPSTNNAPSINSVPSETHGDPWVSGFLRRLPYTGVLALFVVLLCAGADVVVLYKSDGQEVDTWRFPPSVLLAVFSATANVCLEYARSEGVILAWWRKALRGGTLYDLSRYWESGDSILGAIKSGRGFNFVAVATVIASAIVLDGPLLQQASTIVSKPKTTTVNVTAPIAQELPYGFTAIGGSGGPTGQAFLVMNQTFAQVVNSYIIKDNITTTFTGCTGKCSGTVKAAGLAIDCSSDSVPWNTNSTIDANHDNVVFSSNFTWIPGDFRGVPADYNGTGSTNPFPGTPWIQFDLVSVSGRVAPFVAEGTPGGTDGGPAGGGKEFVAFCNGTMVRKSCSLRSATLNYPIEMLNGTISLKGNSSAYTVDHIQPYGKDPDPPIFTGDRNPMTFITLGGIAAAARNMFTARAEQDDQGLGFLEKIDGSLASQYINYGPEGHDYITTMDACAINWDKDPTDDIMNALNEMMFRTALVAKDFPKYKLINGTTDQWWSSYYEAFPPTVAEGDNGMPVPQTIAMDQFSTVNIFQSHYSYLGAALVVMITGILVVIPTFNGFWELGRSTSLNPLEIAKAFNPDILSGTGSNASSKHLDKAVGKREIQYGEVVDEGLSVAGYAEHDSLRFRGRRLEIADPSRIKRPEFQAVYS